jgi:hypothetical protein
MQIKYEIGAHVFALFSFLCFHFWQLSVDNCIVMFKNKSWENPPFLFATIQL